MSNKRSQSEESQSLRRVVGSRLELLRSPSAGSKTSYPALVESLKEQFGDIEGFNVTSIGLAESGKRWLSLYALLCVAKHYKKPLTWFLGDKVLNRERELLSEQYAAPNGVRDIPKGAQLSFDSINEIHSGYHIVDRDKRKLLIHIHKDLNDVYTLDDGVDAIKMTYKQLNTWMLECDGMYRVSRYTIEV